METISSVASGVSRAIWGEQTATQNNETGGKEPISGQEGKGTVNEPYDQGNAEDPTSTTAESKNTYDPASSSQDEPSSKATETTSTESTSKSTEPTSKPTESTLAENAPTLPEPRDPIDGSPIAPHEKADETNKTSETSETNETDVPSGPTGGARKISLAAAALVPSEPKSVARPHPASAAHSEPHQGADKPLSAPSAEEEATVSKSKEEAEQATHKRASNDHPSEPKGTGEQSFQASGTVTNGGDFDATKPGAGREADRLVEEKGTTKTASEPKTSTIPEPKTKTSSEPAVTETKEKPKLTERIKDKLHIGHRDK